MTYCANVRIPTEKAHGLQIMKTVAAFHNTGVDIELITPHRANPEQLGADPFAFYHIEKKFPLTVLSSPDPTWLMSCPRGLYIKIQSFFFMLWLFCFLLSKKNKTASILYTREEYLLPILLFFSNHVVWESHGLPRRSKYYKKIWQHCYRIVSVSHGLKDDLVNLGLDQKKIIVAPDGVDLAEFRLTVDSATARQRLDLPSNKKIILYTGQLFTWKGADILAKAASLLPPNYLAVFVGGVGDELSRFQDHYANNKNILILGQKPYISIPLYLRAADVVVLPNTEDSRRSRSWTSPMKLFEYLASGVPIVASDLPSIKEILNEQNSFFFIPSDPASLSSVIQKILSSPNLSRAKTERAVLNIGRYDWSARARLIIENLKIFP